MTDIEQTSPHINNYITCRHPKTCTSEVVFFSLLKLSNNIFVLKNQNEGCLSLNVQTVNMYWQCLQNFHGQNIGILTEFLYICPRLFGYKTCVNPMILPVMHYIGVYLISYKRSLIIFGMMASNSEGFFFLPRIICMIKNSELTGNKNILTKKKKKVFTFSSIYLKSTNKKCSVHCVIDIKCKMADLLF